MGIQDLAPLLRPPNVVLHKLSSLKGMGVKTLGIDVMVWLHMCVKSGMAVVDDFHAIPPVDLLSHIFQFFDKAKGIFDADDLKIILVYDGYRNPLKEGEDQSRKSQIDKSREAMMDVINSGSIDREDEFKKHKKSSVYVRCDLVANSVEWARRRGVQCVGAPFEADYQLVQLELEGVTQGSVCNDSDLFPFGSRLMIQNVKFTKIGNNCNIVIRENVLNDSEIFRGWSGEDIIVFCVLMGCDYLPRCKGNGLVKNKSYMTQWRSQSGLKERNDLLLKIYNGNEASVKQFWLAVHFFSHPPVIRCIHPGVNGQDHILDLIQMHTEVIVEVSDYITLESGSMMMCTLEDIYDMNVWARKGPSEVASWALQPPRRSCDNVKLPWGSMIDFDVVPLEFQPLSHLNRWMNCRNRLLRQNIDPSVLRNTVRRLLDQGFANDQDVVEFSEIGSGHYISWDSVYIEEGAIEWISDFNYIMNHVKYHVSEDLLKAKLLEAKPTAQLRVWNLCRGGHYDFESLSMSQSCKIKERGNVIDVVVFRAKCVASVKQHVYSVVIAFTRCLNPDTDLVSQRYVSYGSQCDCPKGTVGREGNCSHTLALMGVFLFIKLHNISSLHKLVEYCGAPISSVINECIPGCYSQFY